MFASSLRFSSCSLFSRVSLFMLSLLLSACDVEIFVTGNGSVSAEQPDAGRCESAPECYSVGVGSTLTLNAIPGEGYRFAGWGGSCQGQTGDTCSLKVNSHTRVQASFVAEDATQIRPLMQPDTEYFFTAPWPADAYSKTPDGRLDVAAFPTPNDSRISATLKRLAGQATGFSNNGGVYFQLTVAGRTWNEAAALIQRSQDASTQDYGGGYFLDVDPESPRYGERIPANLVPFTPADEDHANDVNKPLEISGLLMLAPVPGYTLRAEGRYAAILLRQQAQMQLQPALLLAQLEAPYHRRLGYSETIFRQLKTQKDLLASMLQAFSFGHIDDVAAFTVFTTQNPKRLDAAVGRAITAMSDEDLLSRITSVQRATEYLGSYDGFYIDLQVPDFMAGEALYFLGGGQIREHDGVAVVQKWNPVRLNVSVPSHFQPDGGYPLIVSAAGTGDPLLFQKRIAIVVEIASPQSPMRRSGSIEKLLEFLALFGVQTDVQDDLINMLVDFNFFNLESAQNLHIQYGAELHYVSRIARLLPVIKERYAEALTHIDLPAYDPELFTLSGVSLGGIATLHALAQGVDAQVVTGFIAPRPSYLHFDDAIVYALSQIPGIEAPIREYSKLDRNQLAQPLLQLLQLALEPMDTLNYADELLGKSVVWNLSDFSDPLHGGVSGYSFATAMALQHPAIPVSLDSPPSGESQTDLDRMWQRLAVTEPTMDYNEWDPLTVRGSHFVVSNDDWSDAMMTMIGQCYPFGLTITSDRWYDLFLSSSWGECWLLGITAPPR